MTNTEERMSLLKLMEKIWICRSKTNGLKREHASLKPWEIEVFSSRWTPCWPSYGTWGPLSKLFLGHSSITYWVFGVFHSERPHPKTRARVKEEDENIEGKKTWQKGTSQKDNKIKTSCHSRCALADWLKESRGRHWEGSPICVLKAERDTFLCVTRELSCVVLTHAVWS